MCLGFEDGVSIGKYNLRLIDQAVGFKDNIIMKKPGTFDKLKIKRDLFYDNLYGFGDMVADAVKGTGEYKDTGAVGERFTYNIVAEEFSMHRTFRNVYITKENGKLTEIDLLAVSKKGIFVFESKNYSGWIFGNSSDKNWVATLPNGKKNRFYNPIKQNETHINALIHNLKEDYPLIKYYSLIVFSERCALKNITYDEPNTVVFQRPELRYYLRQMVKEQPDDVLNQDEIEKIKQWLRERERPEEDVKQQHLDELEQAKNSCPRCGSELVERKNKNTGEAFIGCSSFPKCRYTAKNKEL